MVPIGELLQRQAKRSLVFAVVYGLLGLALVGAAAVTTAVDLATPNADRVTVTATGEGTHRERRGGRRAKRSVTVRHVDVTLPDGSTGQVTSDDIAVGGTAQVWQHRHDGALTANEPWRIRQRTLFLAPSLALVGLMFLMSAWTRWRRHRTLPRVVIETSPRVDFFVRNAGARPASLDREGHGWASAEVAVVASAHAKFRTDGEDGPTRGSLQIDSRTAWVDPRAGLPPYLEGRILQRGLLVSMVAYRATPGQPWSLGEL
jgi:hypothetical protein